MKKIFILLSATVLTVGCSNGYDSVDAQEFSEALKNPDVQIIDTRTHRSSAKAISRAQ